MGKNRSPYKRAERRRPARGAKANRRPPSAIVVGAGMIALGLLAYFLLVRPERTRAVPHVEAGDNVLLITLDTTRADHLGCYGYDLASTPNLDGLAREGVRFARGYCPAPLTLPSHSTIMTGLYPAKHGVRNNGHGRFFAWVHYYDPHLPYDPPSLYREGSPGRPYDGEIAYMDHYVGAVLDRLKAKGVLDKTLIVVAGDHGEGLGDKVETGHGIFLYEETLRVPLIFYNLKAFPRPRVVESTVRLVDVAPTILETIGLKLEAAAMQGQTLTP